MLDDITVRTVELIPITPDDLPGYAVRLYDAATASPDVSRFVAWYQLQRGTDTTPRASVEEATREKITKVAAALDEGTITSPLNAAELVLTIQAIARMWTTQPRETLTAAGEDTHARRDTVRTAVQALVARR